MNKTSLRILLLVVLALTGCSREPKTVAELSATGDKAYFDQKYPEARSYYFKALAQKPSEKHVLYFTGMSYSRQEIWDSALSYLKRADLLYPNDREINSEIRQVARETENWPYVVQAIKVLIATGDPEMQYWQELAEMYVKSKQPSMAYFYQRKIVNAGSNEPQDYMRLINIALALDSLPIAKAYLDTALTKFGPHIEFTANHAYILAYERQYDQAEKLFREVLAQDSSSIGYKLGLANVLSFSKDSVKLRESLALYHQIKDATGNQFQADSMINVLEQKVR